MALSMHTSARAPLRQPYLLCRAAGSHPATRLITPQRRARRGAPSLCVFAPELARPFGSPSSATSMTSCRGTMMSFSAIICCITIITVTAITTTITILLLSVPRGAGRGPQGHLGIPRHPSAPCRAQRGQACTGGGGGILFVRYTYT